MTNQGRIALWRQTLEVSRSNVWHNRLLSLDIWSLFPWLRFWLGLETSWTHPCSRKCRPGWAWTRFPASFGAQHSHWDSWYYFWNFWKTCLISRKGQSIFEPYARFQSYMKRLQRSSPPKIDLDDANISCTSLHIWGRYRSISSWVWTLLSWIHRSSANQVVWPHSRARSVSQSRNIFRLERIRLTRWRHWSKGNRFL